MRGNALSDGFAIGLLYKNGTKHVKKVLITEVFIVVAVDDEKRIKVVTGDGEIWDMALRDAKKVASYASKCR